MDHLAASLRHKLLRAIYADGCSHLAQGRHADAATAFAAAFAQAPDFADAAQNLGCSLFALRRFDDAAQAYADVVRLRPDAGAHYNHGMALLAGARHADALAPLHLAAALEPSAAKHHHALAQALAKADRPAAIPALIQAIGHHPADASLYALLAGVLVDEGLPEPGAGAALQAVHLAPECGQSQGNLARALQALGRSDAALPPSRAAVRLRPRDGGAAATLGAVLYSLGHYAEALEVSRRALLLAPALHQAKGNEALALEALGRVDEAVAAGNAAVAMAPGDAPTRHNLACTLLADGRMTAEAWDLYDARLHLNPAARAVAAIPRWRGEDVAGRTVLLHCEQGHGDTIQFARYAHLVADRGARVILAVQPALVRLLHDTPGAAAVVDATAALPPHDVFCPLLSLPGVFGTTLDTVPPASRLCLGERTGPGLQVGLTWAGSTTFVHDAARSVGLAALAPLADVPGVTFHSLQWPIQPADGFPLHDAMADVRDFADTAAIIAGLDLVIAVDSAVAHLAATMGKEVWLLSRHMGCWRWLRNRADSPWYPSLRLYRQDRPGDWAGVIGRVRSDLVRRATGRTLAPAEPARRPTALDDLVLPPDAPRVVLAFVGENLNGSLRAMSQGFLDLLTPYGLSGRVLDLHDPGWLSELERALDEGVLFAWGAAGIGARLPQGDGLLWDAARVPFISVLADSPCSLPANHRVPSRWVANGYCYRDWLDVQRRLIRSRQLSALLPVGVLPNPHRDARRWSSRPRRMLFVKTGSDPALHRIAWADWPRTLRAVAEDASAAALRAGVADITGVLLDCLDAHGLSLDGRTDMLFGLQNSVDGYVRDTRSTAMVGALLDLPADIIGSGWDHVIRPGCRARFHPPLDAAELPALCAETAFLVNTMPNFTHGTHERVLYAFAARACVVTNENASMHAQFGKLPSYFAVDTDAPNLAAHLAAIFETASEPDTTPALDLVSTQFSAEGYLRALIDLALTVRATPEFDAWQS